MPFVASWEGYRGLSKAVVLVYDQSFQAFYWSWTENWWSNIYNLPRSYQGWIEGPGPQWSSVTRWGCLQGHGIRWTELFWQFILCCYFLALYWSWPIFYQPGASKNNEVTKFEDDSDDDDWSERPAKKDDKSKKPPEKEESKKKESTFLGGVFSKNKETAPPKLPTRKIVGERFVFNFTTVKWNVLLQWRLCNSARVVPRTRMSITRTCSWGGTSTSWREPSTTWTPSQTTSSTWVMHLMLWHVIYCHEDTPRLGPGSPPLCPVTKVCCLGCRPGAWRAPTATRSSSADRVTDRGRSPTWSSAGTSGTAPRSARTGAYKRHEIRLLLRLMLEWLYFQVTIEGFDPAKFKAANKTSDTTSRTDLRSLNINTTQASTLR